MSEPERGRRLEKLASELRAEVPVRPEWRARLLDEIARSPRPLEVRGTGELDGSPAEELSNAWRRETRITLRPIAGIAAALAFAALGAGVTLATMAWRDRASRPFQAIAVGAEATPLPPTDAAVAADAGAANAAEPVRFALAAPQASRVALVGSFNRWNPAATPLVRDPATGKWTVTVRLPPGRHVYAFVVDGDVRIDPSAPRTADDDFGAPSSVILVAGPAS